MMLKINGLAGLLALVLALTTVADANDWQAVETESETYLKATAHEPNYQDRELWPYDAREAAYASERWEPGRVLVWAHTGEMMRVENPTDPSHWLENGEPATEGPDEHTDLVIPADAKLAARGTVRARHITVQPGARARFQQLEIFGNLWIKRTASFGRAHGFFGAADKNNFCRNDNEKTQFIANMFTQNKVGDQSTEWIGRWEVGDEVNLIAGRMVIAPHSTFMPTDRRVQKVYADAELVLHSGSALHLRGNQYASNDLEVRGTIRAGTASRPLTEDCTIGLSFKSHGAAGTPGNPGDRGLLLYEEGAIVVTSADPNEAQLVINWHRRPNESSRDFADGEPEAMQDMPHGIELVLLGETRFNGVRFEDVLAGGIQMPDPGIRERWQNVTYGESNFAEPDELFGRVGDQVDTDGGNWGGGRGVAPESLQPDD